jgi:5-deoxy-D-glucuronate isomerase
MQLLTLPPNWDGYPNHKHDAGSIDPNQEEVYIPLEGSATLEADGQAFDMRPGMMVRVGPKQLRQIKPGPDGIRLIALGGAPGAFKAAPWTEVGGPLPEAA